jgi:hypothetical protein
VIDTTIMVGDGLALRRSPNRSMVDAPPFPELPMRYILIAVAAVAVASCSSADKSSDAQKASVTPAGAAAAPAGLKLADVAGNWTMKTMTEKGDSTLLTFTMTATSDTTGWSITFAGRQPIPGKVLSVAGDSVILHSGPYESALRKGVQVTSHTILHFQGGKFVGTTTGHYSVKTADSVRTFRMEGTRAQ